MRYGPGGQQRHEQPGEQHRREIVDGEPQFVAVRALPQAYDRQFRTQLGEVTGRMLSQAA